jgi:hypothetical protein
MAYKISDLKAALRNGPYAWPGGYPLYFVAGDGEAMSFDAVRGNFREICRAMLCQWGNRDWRIVGHEINWENEDLYCAHTGERIESAYTAE